MRFRPVILVRALLLVSLIHFLVALAAPAEPLVPERASEPSSVSGKVAGLSETQLTLTIAREHQTLNTFVFVLEINTKIDGALVVGAHATVDYRTSGDHLVATHVVATPSSGISPY